MGSLSSDKPHAVCMPFPAQGHMNSMLKLAKVLHSMRFYITFVNTEFNHQRILRTRGPSALQGFPDFRFETIPDGLPLAADEDAAQEVAAQDVAARCISIHNCSASFRELISKLNNPSSLAPPVTCIVSDFITSFTLEVAVELGIPDVFYCSASACGLMGLFHYKHLVEKGIMPFKNESDLMNKSYLDTPIDWIPGMKNIRLRDLPSFFRTTDPDDVLFNFLKDEMEECYRATAMIINTFDDLEGPVLDAMSTMIPPIYTVGPLALVSNQIMPECALESVGLNLWKEDSGCLEWLEGRAARSVVYVNYGSTAKMTNEQLLEFAWGLANSGYDFLWVIRPDVALGDSAVLPEEFLMETGGRSMLASWCPQETVLSHPAIGCFLTHCGWNSIMDSMCAGVPMVCWPFFGDQQTNCRYLCAEWGVGMEINNQVRREEVEAMLRELMEGEKGMEMKRRVLEWKESAVRATQSADGRSFVNLQRVVKEVLLRDKNI